MKTIVINIILSIVIMIFPIAWGLVAILGGSSSSLQVWLFNLVFALGVVVLWVGGGRDD